MKIFHWVIALAAASVLAACNPVERAGDARAEVDFFHERLNAGDDDAIWAVTGEEFRSTTSKEDFARLLGKYVREEQALPLGQAIHQLTTLPATNLKLRDRGALAPGYFADVVVFDPATIQDNATYAEPHQYATGVRDVLVNGVPVLRDGEHTGATPGRVVRGPGWEGWTTTD